MQDEQIGGKRHQTIRTLLRLLGPLVLLVGVVFVIAGIASFFSSFGSHEPPSNFWCAIVGIPLIGIGGGICHYAFIGAVARYVVNEIAPIAKDAVNYLGKGTQDGVTHVIQAIAEGAAAARRPDGAPILCRACKASNEAHAKFCNRCGTAL